MKSLFLLGLVALYAVSVYCEEEEKEKKVNIYMIYNFNFNSPWEIIYYLMP